MPRRRSHPASTYPVTRRPPDAPICCVRYSKVLTHTVFARLALLLSAASVAAAQPSVLLDAMSQELNRNFSVLKEKADPPPYFLSYEVTERSYRSVTGTLGTIEFQWAARTVRSTFRSGSVRRKLDNYHRVRGDRGQFTSGEPLISFEDNVNAIKRRLWLETDRAYRAAAERLIRIKTNTQVRVAEADDSDDFSTEPPSTFHAGARRS